VWQGTTCLPLLVERTIFDPRRASQRAHTSPENTWLDRNRRKVTGPSISQWTSCLDQSFLEYVWDCSESHKFIDLLYLQKTWPKKEKQLWSCYWRNYLSSLGLQWTYVESTNSFIQRFWISDSFASFKLLISNVQHSLHQNFWLNASENHRSKFEKPYDVHESFLLGVVMGL